MASMKEQSKLFGGILLVSGTTIGAGMLALPVSTGLGGFWPSIALLIFYWAYMTYTAFLMLEVNLWFNEKTNLISMVKKTLGRWAEVVSWFVYLFLLYSLTTAYIAGSGPIVIDGLASLFGFSIPEWIGVMPLFAIFGYFVCKGTRSVDRVNRFLMLGLVLAYVMMVIFLTPHVEKKLLAHVEWKFALMGFSVVATSFGFHIIIPSLVCYLDQNVRLLKLAILLGGLIPLVMYISWEFLSLGIIPVFGDHSILEGYLKGSNGVHLLSAFLNHSKIAVVAQFFSFFAIVTSFLGVSLSLSHFLADGLKVKETGKEQILIYILTFLPPLIITLFDQRAFLRALEYAGAFGVVTLLGLFPGLMVWSGRYYQHLDAATKFRTPGGKMTLLLIILISLFVIALEVAIQSNWFSLANSQPSTLMVETL